jgi:hypothetical protein
MKILVGIIGVVAAIVAIYWMARDAAERLDQRGDYEDWPEEDKYR